MGSWVVSNLSLSFRVSILSISKKNLDFEWVDHHRSGGEISEWQNVREHDSNAKQRSASTMMIAKYRIGANEIGRRLRKKGYIRSDVLFRGERPKGIQLFSNNPR